MTNKELIAAVVTCVSWMNQNGSLTQQRLEKFFISLIQLPENVNGKANLTRCGHVNIAFIMIVG